MWRPPERIRYQPIAGPWPSVERAARSQLFSPMQVGPLHLEQRTWVPAMVPWRATQDGFVSDNVLAWYERFARGCPGAIVVEATGIRDVPSGPLLRIGSDRFIPGLRVLAAVVRRASGGRTRLLIQLIDFLAMRRRPERAKYFERLLRITPAHRDKLALADASEEEVRARLASLDEDSLRDLPLRVHQRVNAPRHRCEEGAEDMRHRVYQIDTLGRRFWRRGLFSCHLKIDDR